VQITRTTPLRLMILQLRQIFFTEAITFMIYLIFRNVLSLLGSKYDSRPS
jgi:hypothetical protein